MTELRHASADRRRVLLGGLAAVLAPGLARAAGKQRIVTLLGDSITAGYGLPYADSLPAQLQAALQKSGANVRVRAAGVSGDTSAGGLARVDFSVQADTELCIVALGGNDLMQGLNPATTKSNLTKIIRRLKARRMKVLLCGVGAPREVSSGFAREFNALYPAVARAEGVALYANLLAGVEGNPALNQRDRIHPNAAGVKIIAARLAPVVIRSLK